MATVEQLKNNLIQNPENKVSKEGPINIKNLLNQENVKKKFLEVLGSKTPSYLASVVSLATVNLKEVEPMSIASSALVSATLDLPINPSLGFAYLVPFKEKQANGQFIKKAQFQLGYKGFIQLALRSGQYKNINVIEIYEGQLEEWNPLVEEIKFNFKEKLSDKVIGYASDFKLINGFEKTVYWSIEDVENHAKKFSKTYNSKYGVWKTNFDAMAKKTVLKNMLSKWGILSIEMQTALRTDQAVVDKDVFDKTEIEDIDLKYSDNNDFIDVVDVQLEQELEGNNVNEEQINLLEDESLNE